MDIVPPRAKEPLCRTYQLLLPSDGTPCDRSSPAIGRRGSIRSGTGDGEARATLPRVPTGTP